MIAKAFLILATIFLFFSVRVSAAVHYVDLNCTNPVPPYTNWSTAATNIQSGINASTTGDLVLVTNGVYQNSLVSFYDTNNGYESFSRFAIPDGVTVASANGPAVTLVQGFGSVTCAFVAGSGVLSGFTLTNGHGVQFGGGVYCNSTNALVTNCLICSNNANYGGGGAYQGTLNHCVISNNAVGSYGGASYGSVLNHCVVIGNTESTIGNRLFTGAAFGGTLNSCLIISNSSYGVLCNSNVMNNCLILSNTAPGTIYSGKLTNCTLCYNSIGESNPLVSSSTLRNCILYYNQYYLNRVEYSEHGNDIQFCCLEPQIYFPANFGPNNFTNAPLFVGSGDFHLQASSPCINAGNNAYVSSTNDFDGNPRIVGGTVDMGAYEFQSPQSIISYQWLQQYGLPTDGSADFADTDGDGMNNWQEWIAGTDPTNPLSVLKMLNPAATTNQSGLVVSWESVNTRTYFLQSSTNLGGQPAFATIQSNLVGQAGTTGYTDTTATNGGVYFYRIGVQ
jgi:hypothetical protein